ncbi:hypothetical protein HDV00_007717, partial [Rhizophlyctis rosea]
KVRLPTGPSKWTVTERVPDDPQICESSSTHQHRPFTSPDEDFAEDSEEELDKHAILWKAFGIITTALRRRDYIFPLDGTSYKETDVILCPSMTDGLDYNIITADAICTYFAKDRPKIFPSAPLQDQDIILSALALAVPVGTALLSLALWWNDMPTAADNVSDIARKSMILPIISQLQNLKKQLVNSGEREIRSRIKGSNLTKEAHRQINVHENPDLHQRLRGQCLELYS